MLITTEEYRTLNPKLTNVSRSMLEEVKNGKLIRLRRGIFSNEKEIDIEYLSSIIYSPSYISFEYACSMYGLIPEEVFAVTCAVTQKNKTKIYKIDYLNIFFRYSDVPSTAFMAGLEKITRDSYSFHLATPEKALCDLLYKHPGHRTIKEIETLIFDDLRVNEDVFDTLDKKKMIEFAKLYPSTTLKSFSSFLKKQYGI